MKIVCGVKNTEEALWAFNNGVDEVYFSYRLIPNHRRNELSVESFHEAIKIIKLGLNKGCGVSLAYNGDNADYDSEHIKKIIYPLVSSMQAKGLKSIILRDPVIIGILRKMGLNLKFNLSSLSLVFNYSAIEIFKKFNISRVVMPLHLSPVESEMFLKNIKRVNIETEFFYYPAHNCQNLDPLCRFCDRDDKGCKILYSKNFFMPFPSLNQMAEYFYYNTVNGADYIKIARTLNFEKIKKSVKVIKKLLSLIDKDTEYKNFVKEFSKIVDVSVSV